MPLASLADDPGMGLGFLDLEALASLPVVTCAAAKSDHFVSAAGSTRDGFLQILAGKSLERYRRFFMPADDPIADVMAASRIAVGLFGGTLRRLLYRSNALTTTWVCQAQALTEQATQRVLSVKAGSRPLPFKDFSRLLNEVGSSTAPSPDNPDLHELFIQMDRAGIWQELPEKLGGDAPLWLLWLRQPYRLAEILRRSPRNVLRLPGGDIRTPR